MKKSLVYDIITSCHGKAFFLCKFGWRTFMAVNVWVSRLC